ncbi:MAG: cystathionine beta-lyase/cystathionine gamma-synthase [Bacteriovoracaceae bacterium]|jgi:cystathionine beta-lyase/cystathionine gamma-synthase
MSELYMKDDLKDAIENMPTDWLRLTTHRLDIYNEEKAKVEFLQRFEEADKTNKKVLSELPTAFDYIRLGHPLSCLLEWAISKESKLEVESVISFSSQTMPILAVLRKNKFLKLKTRIVYKESLPANFDAELLRSIYAYDFDLLKVDDLQNLVGFEGSTLLVNGEVESNADFILNLYGKRGSVIQVMNNDTQYINEIQHVRRRESIAMTPQDCLSILKSFIGESSDEQVFEDSCELNKTIQEITKTKVAAAIGSCGLSVQYAIMMGLIHHGRDNFKDQDIKFIVPPNCYGGTNDQARRVAACISNVEIIDLPVDSGKDMVQELERILDEVAKANCIPYIIAEIPTNPRVEIPELEKLRETLKRPRKTSEDLDAIGPVFILDQTFCPNVEFFGEKGFLRDASTISYVSGSKFPSGGLCTAGYCVANESATSYMSYVEKHLVLCDNKATDLQVRILTENMPSMNSRIANAYKNTRSFVDFMEKNLDGVKINFVTKELAEASFTPSVFSLDLPTKGETPEERENYKRELNHKLIRMMIDALPEESKHCVSYGQLKGCYWTIPATSTQGTTKESDKDYIVRVSIAADFDLEGHQRVFEKFCAEIS